MADVFREFDRNNRSMLPEFGCRASAIPSGVSRFALRQRNT
jgi:hypothetical protein